MLVYVVRHGTAGERGDYDDDFKRPLTRDGAARFKTVARALADIGIMPEKIFTSAYLRARETADMLAHAIHREVVEDRKELDVGHAPEDVLDLLCDAQLGEVALVGHEPQLGHVISLMVAGAQTDIVDLKKSSVTAIEFEGRCGAGKGVILWHLVPSVIEALVKKTVSAGATHP